MHPKSFIDADRQKVIEYLNFVATRSKFDGMSTQDVIVYFGLLSFMQTVLIPKIEANILQVEDVTEAEKE